MPFNGGEGYTFWVSKIYWIGVGRGIGGSLFCKWRSSAQDSGNALAGASRRDVAASIHQAASGRPVEVSLSAAGQTMVHGGRIDACTAEAVNHANQRNEQ